MERPHSIIRTTARALRKSALIVGAALSLGLIYLGTMQLSLRAAPLAEVPRCSVQQKRPFFVGFARGGELDSFERAAVASRDIYRAVRHWLCDDAQAPTGRSGHTPSLRRALLEQRALRAEQLQFDDVPLSRAHLVLAQLGASAPRTAGERGWHVHVARGPEGWSVSHASDQLLAKN